MNPILAALLFFTPIAQGGTALVFNADPLTWNGQTLTL